MFSDSRIATFLQSFITKARGNYATHDLFGGYSALDNMTIRSTDGYTVVVYCQKKQIYQEFDNWFIPNRIMNQYRIFSVPSENAPQVLQEACLLELETDSVFPNILNDKGQKEIAINEYFNLLIKRLRSFSSTA